ncbi:hypothetical protein [Pelotomaculum propionicicum]|uniref:hypothetical protein n=1 Tax=Pelotomaculum propionicicum TaxID=258475 RepID=UPI0016A1CE2C|nr:hypothetical protein [Pelotomaculum propionicicum]NLI12278.1 hypothetical protein [Peptococcaceae bacterium]
MNWNHIEQLEKMARDLEEYFRKTDYRFKQEPKGEEQLAWLKSLRFYVGEEF